MFCCRNDQTLSKSQKWGWQSGLSTELGSKYIFCNLLLSVSVTLHKLSTVRNARAARRTESDQRPAKNYATEAKGDRADAYHCFGDHRWHVPETRRCSTRGTSSLMITFSTNLHLFIKSHKV